MWDGHLSPLRILVHLIDLEPPVSKPVHSVPNRASLAERQLERN